MQEPFDKNEKQKLTLGIDRSVIERAKAAGINISAVTEQYLKSITYEPRGNTRDDVVKAYEALFSSAAPLIRKYQPCVEVGFLDSLKAYIIFRPGYFDVPGLWIAYLDSSQYSDNFDHNVSDVLDGLYEPKVILRNLVLALLVEAERNKEKIRELKLALRFVKALSDDNGDPGEEGKN